MARQVDQRLKLARDTAGTCLSLARNYASLMQEATAELQAATQTAVGGHAIGDKMVAYAARSAAALAQVCSKLADSANAARAIDVTVEVPDQD
ncbi:MAG: hypothetical protein LBD51_09355 [Bifidobacteriaceae bacterium]|jgi:hypothetical protein|nr:hypothetical protein [Bifidobacteriaceae bacterium]